MRCGGAHGGDVLYFYVLGHDPDELALAQAEAQALAGGRQVHPRVVISERRVAPATTAYVTEAAELLVSGSSLDEVASLVRRAKIDGERFRIEVKKIPARLPISTREVAGRLAFEVRGHPDLDRPQVEFLAVAAKGGLWFGRRFSNASPRWLRFRNKLFDFSSALPARMARAAANLAARPGERVVDPCCGSGTILLHAADLGMQVTGCDINPRMVGMSQKNLRHFGLAGDVRLLDAGRLDGRFDAVITNLPYGHFCAITPQGYCAILANCRRLAPRAVFITTVPSTALLRELGYHVDKVIRTGEKVASRSIYCCRSPDSEPVDRVELLGH